MRNNSTYLLLYILFSSCTSLNNLGDCKIEHQKGIFLFEYSSNITVLDDMIAREQGLVHMKGNGNPDYSQGLFIFGEDFLINQDFFNHCNNKGKVYKQVQKYLKYTRRDLIQVLNDRDGINIEVGNKIYKKINVKFTSFYLGKQELNFIIDDEKINLKKVKLYLILDFKLVDNDTK